MRVRRKWLVWVVIALVVLVVAGGAFIMSRVNKLETTKTVGTLLAYDVGKLDQTTGKGMGKTAIEECDDYEGYMHLKEYINADGLKVKLAEKANVEFRVYFFNDRYQLVTSTDWLDEDFNAAEYPEYQGLGIKYAMVEVCPTADADGIITTTEISKYGKMLTIKYNKFDDEE